MIPKETDLEERKKGKICYLHYHSGGGRQEEKTVYTKDTSYRTSNIRDTRTQDADIHRLLTEINVNKKYDK
jgi:hypothetical protein